MKDRGNEKREGVKEKGREDGARELRGEKRDRIGEICPATYFPHVLKEISMAFLDQHLLCTLWGGGGERVRKNVRFVRL